MRWGVNTGHREENIKRGATGGLHSFDIGKQGHGPGQHRVRPTKEHLTTVVIHRQGDIAMCG
jgi:hypothetical protein